MRVPVLCGTGLRKRIQAVGFAPAGAPETCASLCHPLFDVVLNGHNNRRSLTVGSVETKEINSKPKLQNRHNSLEDFLIYISSSRPQQIFYKASDPEESTSGGKEQASADGAFSGNSEIGLSEFRSQKPKNCRKVRVPRWLLCAQKLSNFLQTSSGLNIHLFE